MLKRFRTCAFLGALACSGQLSCSSQGAGDGEGGGDTPPGSDPTEPNPDPTNPPTEPTTEAPGTPVPVPETRLFRLTHEEWENTVQDLLGLPERSGLSGSFPNDPTTAGFLFDNNALSLEVDQVLWQAYQREAATLAATVTGDAQLLEALLPEAATTDTERAQAFIEQFGLRAFRRPVTAGEVERYLEIYDFGTTAYADQPGFNGGIRLLIESFLQSPHFLYRVESSGQANGSLIPLTDWEVAQRLSYFLTDSLPDQELLAEAGAGSLRTAAEVRAAAERLLTGDRARTVMTSFHAELFDVARYVRIAPSPSAFPEASTELATFAVEETRRFVEDVVFENSAGFSGLLRSTDTFVNAELAGIYGLAGDFDDSFVRVALDASERRGLLTQVGFLASNATSVNPDPIHRGVFIAKRLLCINIAAPPDGVPPLPPITDATNREIVADHTETNPTCRACHASLINPYGFPFENYDATGAYRTTDSGFPVDAATMPSIDGTPTSVANAVELAEALATSEQAHDCYARHLIEYAFGRAYVAADAPLAADLTTASQADASTLELVSQLVASPPFLNRSTEELP